MENRKKSRGDLEVRKRASRNKLKEMQDSSESDVPVVKRKKLSKKKPKGLLRKILKFLLIILKSQPAKNQVTSTRPRLDAQGNGANRRPRSCSMTRATMPIRLLRGTFFGGLNIIKYFFRQLSTQSVKPERLRLRIRSG